MIKYAKTVNMRTGLSLVEVMISMAILATLLVGVLSLFSWNFGSQKSSRECSDVFAQISAQMEEIKSLSFQTVLNNYSTAQKVSLTGLNGEMYIKASTVSGNTSLLDIVIAAGWVRGDGVRIGEGTVDATSGKFILQDLNRDGVIDSQYKFKTTIVSKG